MLWWLAPSGIPSPHVRTKMYCCEDVDVLWLAPSDTPSPHARTKMCCCGDVDDTPAVQGWSGCAVMMISALCQESSTEGQSPLTIVCHTFLDPSCMPCNSSTPKVLPPAMDDIKPAKSSEPAAALPVTSSFLVRVSIEVSAKVKSVISK